MEYTEKQLKFADRYGTIGKLPSADRKITNKQAEKLFVEFFKSINKLINKN